VGLERPSGAAPLIAGRCAVAEVVMPSIWRDGRGRKSKGSPTYPMMPLMMPFGDNAWPGAHLPDSIAVQDLFDAARSVGDPKDAPPKLLLLDDFLGDWMDTLGNAVAVAATDYFMGKGLATLSKKGRANILLTLRYDGFGGWVCGNSVLDGCRSSTGCVQWVTLDGRVSIWTRASDAKSKEVAASSAEGEAAPAEAAASADGLEAEEPRQLSAEGL